LPCEVMEHIAIRTQQVSHMLTLRQVCSCLRHQLEGLRAEIQRFRWQQSLTRHTAIDRLGWTLRWTGSGSSFHPGDEWAAAGRLPSCGAAVWLVGISAFAQQIQTSVPKLSRIYVGVCNEAGTSAWALHLADGRLRRWSRDAAGRVRGAPTPANFPNGHMRQVMVDQGKEVDCTTVECTFDSDCGALCFRIGGGPLVTALDGFPPGARMRPFVRLANLCRATICPSR